MASRCCPFDTSDTPPPIHPSCPAQEVSQVTVDKQKESTRLEGAKQSGLCMPYVIFP